jgi:hypothetical protein
VTGIEHNAVLYQLRSAQASVSAATPAFEQPLSPSQPESIDEVFAQNPRARLALTVSRVRTHSLAFR